MVPFATSIMLFKYISTYFNLDKLFSNINNFVFRKIHQKFMWFFNIFQLRIKFSLLDTNNSIKNIKNKYPINVQT